MKCPVCQRELAPTLSICLTCGAMRNDSVREELQLKPGGRRPERAIAAAATPAPSAPSGQLRPTPGGPTGGLHAKQTSPTLKEFQQRQAVIPEWRLQLQNAVRQRSGARAADPEPEFRKQVVSAGANALQAEFVEEPAPEVPVPNERVAKALKRIEESRRRFLPANDRPAAPPRTPAPTRNYPFNVVTRTGAAPSVSAAEPAPAAPAARPRLVSALKIEKRSFDTNKLRPLPKEITDEFESNDAKPEGPEAPAATGSRRIEIRMEEPDEVLEPETDELDDLAGLPMRFNAGLFDVTAGGFVGLMVLTPFLFKGEWFSISGLLLFAAVFAIVMFVYLTATIGFFGRTLGMRMFSLELLDVNDNEYPTLRQAAVHSSVYLLSLATLGLGFLPMLFNEEKRAAHDLAAGTILVREI
jgi:uncharacterized RDD family membrane protein YckC